jgi:hypothetical protein
VAANLARGGGDRYVHVIGEVGVLKDVMPLQCRALREVFLVMEHEGRKYIGTLVVRDPVFCRKIYELLVEQRGKAIQEIAEIELSSMLNK